MLFSPSVVPVSSLSEACTSINMSGRSNSCRAEEVFDEPATVTFAGPVQRPPPVDVRPLPEARSRSLREARSRSRRSRRMEVTRVMSCTVVVSTLDHKQFMAEVDQSLLLAYDAFKADQKAIAKVWPRAKAMSRPDADAEVDYEEQKCAHCSFAVTGIVTNFCCWKCKASAGLHGEKCKRRAASAIERRPGPSAAPGSHHPGPSATPEKRPYSPLEPPALQPRGSVARAMRARTLAAARLQTLKNSRNAAALRGLARRRYWLYPCGGI